MTPSSAVNWASAPTTGVTPRTRVAHEFVSLRWWSLVILLSCVNAVSLTGQAVMKGKVLMDPSDVPLGDAEVVLEALSRSARTTNDGEFFLGDLPAGRHRVLVRRIGYQPSEYRVTLKDRDTLEITFTLTPLPVVLESLLAAGTPPVPASPRLREFEERRRMGIGRFVTWTELRLREELALAAVLGAEGVRIVAASGHREVAVSPRSGSNCPMQVWLDGVLIARGGRIGLDLSLIPVRSLGGIEIYRSAVETPLEFGLQNSQCGTLVLWTRNR
jgi:hypothetical protein